MSAHPIFERLFADMARTGVLPPNTPPPTPRTAGGRMSAAERTELLRAIDECANQARDLADKYGIPSLLTAATRLHEAADIVESA